MVEPEDKELDMKPIEPTPAGEKKRIYHEKGITFFDRGTERSFFFVMTVIMLVLGLLYKFGVM
jgi:hypothetical protein